MALIHKSPNFRGWDDFPLRDKLVKMTSLPVYLANDVNAAAIKMLLIFKLKLAIIK